jgi:hypothetical protein
MRFYRVESRGDGGISCGCTFFTSREAAKKAERTYREPGEQPGDIDVIDVVPTKAGILAGLNRWASHPDNG